jgi:2-isopropylmalate synthase
MTDKLIIFDTTLRDGEQSPGASMTKDEKVRIARQLERLRVDVIEAGFAASSHGDAAAIAAVAAVVKDSIVCSLARANEKDITIAAESLKAANAKRIHTFIATSALHMEKKLRMTPDQVFDQAKAAVRFARKFTNDVEFSPEDGYRSDMDFLCRILEAVIKEGATTLNIPDTVGYAVPELYGHFIKTLRTRIPNSDKAIWSVHCHNDLGMGVANSLAGVVTGGARQVECTINGLGERAGNTSLEEIVMAVRTRKDFFKLDLRIDATQIVPASKLVSQITGFVVQPNKAVVGANAFAHASGIHQDGVLKARDTYEIMRAEDVGWSANRIVLGLTASSHVVFAELPWEPASAVQAEDRAHRIGQDNAVVAWWLLAVDNTSEIPTVDDRMWALLNAKHETVSAVLTGHGEDMGAEGATSITQSLIEGIIGNGG